jgi:broad specificity phosphatase PhoE
MATTTLVLVRHVRTVANGRAKQLRMAGWSDSEITAEGQRQLDALRVSDTGAAAGVIYTSTSHRAMVTAEALDRGGRIVPLRSLREICCGLVDGWLIDDVERMFPSFWKANLEQADPDFRWPGGESYREFRGRALRAMRGIALRHPGERVVVVTHAGVIAQVLGAIAGVSPARWSPWRPENGSMTVVEWSQRARLLDFSRQPPVAAAYEGGHPPA